MSEQFFDIIQSEQATLVDFFATWCGPCKMMQPILQELKAQLGEGVRILKIDVDKNPALAGHYQVQGVPTLIVFKKSEIQWRQSGVVTAPELARIIKTHKNQ